MASVFVCFRNGDEPFAAALLYRALTQRFGAGSVFRSSDCLPPGVTWADRIWENHRRSQVVVVVIGPRWLTVADERGRPRLWQRQDWVRQEIARALRSGKLVIPVLVGGARRVTREELPPSLATLAARQSVAMEHRTVDEAVDRIAAAVVDRVAAADRDGPAGPTDPPAPQSRSDNWLAIWNIPSRIPSYGERSELVRALRSDVEGARGAGPAVLHGGIGVGKSQLAIEYAYRFAGDYHCAWWVSGNSPELLWTQLSELAHAAGVDAGAGIGQTLPILARALDRRGRWLLCLDGFDDPRPVVEVLTATGAGADVLITSRSPEWGTVAAARRAVGPFARPLSVELLAGRLPEVAPADLDRLAASLDDLPLALAQAATFIPGSTLTTRQYVELLHSRSRDLLARGDTYRYPRPLGTAWSIGVERLRETTEAAELLTLLSVFAPAPVPLDLMQIPADPIRRADTVRALAESGLVEVIAGRPAPRGLFQAFLRDGSGPAHLAATHREAQNALAGAARPDPSSGESWSTFGPLLPHVLALDLATSRNPRCHDLLLDTARHLVERGDPGTARELTANAAAAWEAAYGPDAAQTLAARSRLAQAHFRLREYREALAIDRDLLARHLRQRGVDDPATMAAAHDVAVETFAVSGADSGTERMLSELVARRSRILGPYHPDTLRSAHNLALVRRSLGEVPAARDLDQATHSRLVEVLGDDHPDTLRSAHSLTLDLRLLGQRGPARQLAEETHRRRSRVLGPDHPDTLASACEWATCSWLAGDARAARELAGQAYPRCATALGDGHPTTVRLARLLGTALGPGQG